MTRRSMPMDRRVICFLAGFWKNSLWSPWAAVEKMPERMASTGIEGANWQQDAASTQLTTSLGTTELSVKSAHSFI